MNYFFGFKCNLTYCLLVGLLLYAPPQYAQWEVSTFGGDFQRVSFGDNNTVYVVGPAGTMMRSNDAGITWQMLQPSASNTVNAMAAVGSQLVVLVGDGGMIRRSTDGGTNWTNPTSGTTNNLLDVEASSATTFYAVGDQGTVIKSTDSGATWTTVPTGVTANLGRCSFINDQEGWVAYWFGETILKTSDGGSTWTTQTAALAEIEDIAFVDADLGYICQGVLGDFYIRPSTDGGDTWPEMAVVIGRFRSFWAGAAGSNQALAVGDDCRLAYQNSGTGNWVRTSVPDCFDQIIYDVASSGSTDIAVGENEYLVHTSTYGALSNGTIRTFSSGTGFRAFKAVDQNHWYITTTNSDTPLYYTADAGQSWAQIRPQSNFLSDYDIDFAGNFGCLTTRGSSVSCNLDATDPTTWSSAVFTGVDLQLHGIEVYDNQNIWAVGRNGRITYSSNGGNSWLTQSAPVSDDFWDVVFTDPNTGWIVGGSAILHTTNGGNTWTTQSIPSSANLFGVDFVSTSEGWAVGSNGQIFHTTDGGNTWTAQTSNTTATLREVYFVTTQTGFAVGSNGTVVFTQNGGTTWTPESTGVSSTLAGIIYENGVAYVAANGAQITAQRPVAILPVELQSFVVRNVREGLQLQWTTASEENTAFFEVEHSRDGKDFSPLDQQGASGGRHTAKDYVYLHRNPAAGQHYYRLRTVDFDRTVQYSEVRAAQWATAPGIGSFSPNPIHKDKDTHLRLGLLPALSGRVFHITFYDLTGREAFYLQGEIETGQQHLSIPTHQMKAGLYYARILLGSESYTQHLLIIGD